jgi:TRAP-type mannitol/chloroaromatic compound transport system substrate-binding protein
MLQSFHQSSEQFEILFNKTKYDALPQDLKHIIDYAVQASSADMSWKATDRYSQDYVTLRTTDKVSFYKTPDAILRTQLDVWDKMLEAKSAENPQFKRVADSMKAFAERACRYDFDYNVDYRMAYNRYFGRPAAAPAKKA